MINTQQAAAELAAQEWRLVRPDGSELSPEVTRSGQSLAVLLRDDMTHANPRGYLRESRVGDEVTSGRSRYVRTK
jgi:hypothetical protein